MSKYNKLNKTYDQIINSIDTLNELNFSTINTSSQFINRETVQFKQVSLYSLSNYKIRCEIIIYVSGNWTCSDLKIKNQIERIMKLESFI